MQDPVACLLDLTRLMSRAGRVLTGVDRVEYAYLHHLIGLDVPVFGLVRTSLGYLLLDRSGMAAMARAVDSGIWAKPDILSRLSRRLDPPRRGAESYLRAVAFRRSLPYGLGAMLLRNLPAGVTYLNVGHSNLTERVLTAVRRVQDARIVVLIHDTIPLDWPDFQRAGTVAEFAAKAARVGRHADHIICPSNAVQGDLARHLAAIGRVPPITVVPLGVSVPVPDPAMLPAGIDLTRPYFVCLGTIEPRKNHRLLLDVWDRLAASGDPPLLYICGSRGWNNEDVFARLDAALPGVVELSGLSDGAVAALLKDARALLFPSRAEGFGIPLAEAAALGTPVICSDLPVCREVLGDRAVYLNPNDVYGWQNCVTSAVSSPFQSPAMFLPPDWATHFKTALRLT